GFTVRGSVSPARARGVFATAVALVGCVFATNTPSVSAASAISVELLGNPGDHASEAVVNDHGEVAGRMIADGHAPGFFRSADGTVTNIGTLGGVDTNTYGINNSGVVVGSSANNAGKYHAFRWNAADGMVDLAAGSALVSHAYAVNEGGDAVGI